MTLLKVEQGHFVTVILILHNFFLSFITVTGVWKHYIENTFWKVLAYGIYTLVVDVSEIERVSAANE